MYLFIPGSHTAVISFVYIEYHLLSLEQTTPLAQFTHTLPEEHIPR